MSEIRYTPPASSGGTTINPTNYFIPIRVNATTFDDSVLYQQGVNQALKTTFAGSFNGLVVDDANKNYILGSYALGNQTYTRVNDASTYIAQFTNGTERMRINSIGEICIGTSTAFFSSATRGNVSINGSVSSILALGIAGNYGAYFYSASSLTEIGSSSQLNFVVNGGNNAMRIDLSGNVGIGTSTPAQKLDVNGLIRTNRISNTDGGLIFGTVGTYLYGADSGGYLATYTSNTERMRVTSAGNVGIGTSSPFSVSALTLKESSSLFFALSLENRNSSQRWDIAVDINAVDDKILGILDGTSGTTRLAITDTGYVGIGTTIIDPSAQLQVDSNNESTGFLAPRLTDSQIRAIVSPAEGLQIYNTDINHMCFYQSGSWVKISSSPM